MTITAQHSTAASAPEHTIQAEREHRKLVLAATLRLFAARGYEYGFNGHLTVRDPGTEDHYWANPLGVPFGLTKVSDLVLVDNQGRTVSGHRLTSVPGFLSQHVLHSARPDALAVVHAHSFYGFALSSSPTLLEPLTTDAALLDGLQALHLDFGRVATDGKTVATTADSLGPEAKILIQRSHGFVTIGRSIEEAAFYFIAAERAAHTQLLLRSAGGGEPLAAAALPKWRVTPEIAEAQFLPFLQQTLADNPDLAH